MCTLHMQAILISECGKVMVHVVVVDISEQSFISLLKYSIKTNLHTSAASPWVDDTHDLDGRSRALLLVRHIP